MDRRYRDTRAYRNTKRYNYNKALAWLIVLLVISGFSLWIYSNINKNHFNVTSSSISTKTSPMNPFLGWKTLSDKKMTLQYPGGWSFTESTNPQIGIYGTSSAFSAATAGVPDNSTFGTAIALHIQVGPFNSAGWCTDIKCKVIALIPLNNSQLKDDSLAVVNQTGQSGTTTFLMLVNSATRVGASAVTAATAGQSLAIIGYPEYYSSNTVAHVALVTDEPSFQSNSNMIDLVSMLNNLQFK